MATSLTTDQKITLCEILHTPYSTSFYTIDGLGTLASQTTIADSTAVAVKPALLAWLDTLDANTETRLIVYLTRWNTIGTTTTNISGGSVGEVNGVSLDYEKERELIRDRVLGMVPFFVQRDIEKRSSGNPGAGVASGGGSVPLIR